MSDLFYGVAYYDEYMPEDRLAKDIALMRETISRELNGLAQ